MLFNESRIKNILGFISSLIFVITGFFLIDDFNLKLMGILFFGLGILFFGVKSIYPKSYEITNKGIEINGVSKIFIKQNEIQSFGILHFRVGYGWNKHYSTTVYIYLKNPKEMSNFFKRLFTGESKGLISIEVHELSKKDQLEILNCLKQTFPKVPFKDVNFLKK
jgi:hypothetical protein